MQYEIKEKINNEIYTLIDEPKEINIGDIIYWISTFSKGTYIVTKLLKNSVKCKSTINEEKFPDRLVQLYP